MPDTHISSTTLPSPFERYRPHIELALRKRLDKYESPLYQMLRYSMGWADADGKSIPGTTGKTLRPVLCLCACEATGSDYQIALPSAAALEFIHNFSLIHDDIQDRDELRHHKPTLWKLWGDAKAIVAGNSLRTIADSSVIDIESDTGNSKEAVMVAGLLTEAYLEMIEGQYLDMAYETQQKISLQAYLAMISRKTGALIRCAMNIGAAIGTSDRKTVNSFRECGQSLGYVFQIRDDILGVWGSEKTIGKPVGADIKRKKKSLPAVYAMTKASGEAQKTISRKYLQNDMTEDDIAEVLEIMEDVGVREYANKLAIRHCEEAMEHLSGIEMSTESRKDIEDIARFLLVRDH